MKKQILIFLFVLGLVYVLSPGPTKVEDFPAISDSLKSNEPGDTYQVPNISAYFSDYDRAKITDFYRKSYREAHLFFLPPISLSHPPEYAKKYVRDEQMSTFVEEYVYPLRGSLFVNGYEPYVANELNGKEHNFIGDHIHIDGRYFVSKTTLRFYPADPFSRVIVYLGIWLVVGTLYLLSKKAKI